MRNFKKLASMLLALSIAASLLATTAFAKTDFEYTDPKEPVDVTQYDNVLTTLTQRAGSEIPLIFGLNVVGGNMFNGLQYIGGTVVNENPDPYVWNFNYMFPGAAQMTIPDTPAAGHELPDGTYYKALGNTLNNPNGLYNSGGANQNYSVAVDELGGVGYAVGYRNDVIIGFNTATVDQIDMVRSWKEGDEYYQTGDENYSPLIIDVQTGSVTSRMYTWAEMGQALSAYLAANPGKTTRYGDPYTIGVNVEEFSAGIPYYIASQIAGGAIEKKTLAYVSSIDGYTLTCVDPGTVGTVAADVYAEVNNFNFLSGSFTLTDLMEKGIDVIALQSSGYGYTASTAVGGGNGGNGGGGNGGGQAAVDTSKQDILRDLAKAGYDPDEVPLIMDTNTLKVTIGTNGWNYAPTTCLLLPYVQAYAYMDELVKVNPAINPVAMLQYAIDEFCHVEDSSAADVALYYIGSYWDSVDDDYDRVPNLANYTYDKSAVESAIKAGITYALSGSAGANGNTLLAAYRTNDNAYVMLTKYVSDVKPADGHESITLTIDGKTKYLDLTDLAAVSNAEEETEKKDAATGTNGVDTSTFHNVRTEYQAIIDYYNSGKYGYGNDLQTTLQDYADHMSAHVWSPDISAKNTYGYGLGGSKPASPAASSSFTDVAANAWYAEYVAYVAEQGIMNGNSNGTFNPNGSLTRAEMCQIIYNMAGKPDVGTPAYGDVSASAWYAAAVSWCVDNGVAASRSETAFEPNAAITREEVASFLYHYTVYQGKDTPAGDLSAFTDVSSVSNSMVDAMSWAVGAKIITGATTTTLNPGGTATRAQIATMMMRFCEAV